MNYELLREAISIIEKVPECNFRLELIRQEVSGCGTCGCAAGWLAMDEGFSAKTGIRTDGCRLEFYGFYGYDAIMAAVFGVGRTAAVRLFGPRTPHENMTDISDKQLWLQRAEKELQ